MTNIKIDDKLEYELTPVAHCYSGQSYTEEEILIDILDKLGYDNEIIDKNFVKVCATFKIQCDEVKLKLHLNSTLKEKLKRKIFKEISIAECSPFFGIDENGFMFCNFLNVFRYQGYYFIEKYLEMDINDFNPAVIKSAKYKNGKLFFEVEISHIG